MRHRLRALVAAARAADPLEFEQGRLRLTNNSLLTVFFVGWMLWDATLDRHELVFLLLGIANLIVVLAFTAWILARPGVNPLRRYASPTVDIAALTLFMWYTDDLGVILYGVYLWVVLGNGFRFGLRLMRYAHALAIVSFSVVVAFTEFWQGHPLLSAGLLLPLVAVPLYVSVLMSRLNSATQRLESALERAEQASRSKTKFLAAASHDLRQPMQALSMYATVLGQRVREPEAVRAASGVQLSVQTLDQLFESLLDISKIESGVTRPNPIVFPLMPLMERIVETERPVAALKRLELRVARTSAHVLSDPALLERMLKNLLTNAVRYTERGWVMVGCRRVGDERLRLDVIDTGAGIPAAEQERIFEEYYQLEGASAQGLGLGLPIVRALGELLGHKVSVRSTPGRGSVFSIELRRAQEAPAPAAERAPLDARAVGLRILLVDDDAPIRESVRMLLESWGCIVVSGASLSEINYRAAAVPDAVIADYRLADGMTGLEVIRRLRGELGAGLPALLITGTSNLALLQGRLGGVPVAVKPVAPGKLRAFLAHAAKSGGQVGVPEVGDEHMAGNVRDA